MKKNSWTKLFMTLILAFGLIVGLQACKSTSTEPNKEPAAKPAKADQKTDGQEPAPVKKPAPEPTPTPTPEPAAQPSAASLGDVRADLSGQEELLALITQLEEELDRIEKETKAVSKTSHLDDSQVFTFDLSHAPAKGPENAKLQIVVFTDFQCPFCKVCATTMEKLVEEFPNDVRLYFMHFPLDQACNPVVNRPFHQSACLAAEAAMAANAHGKFWEMHDYIFANAKTFNLDSLAEAAAKLGLDADAFKKAVESNQYNDIIQDHIQQFIKAGGRGTPTVYINGKLVQGPRWDSVELSIQFIRELLNPTEEKPVEFKQEVAAPGALPTARIILEDGTNLEDRINQLLARLKEIQLGPGR